MRKTKQKMTIEKTLNNIHTFFSAEELYKQVKKEDQDIGIATIYRYLRELKKKKKIHSYTCNRKQIYSKEKRSHCHFTCEKTGRTFHINIDSLDFLKDKLPGDITSFQIEVKGVCHDCEKNQILL